MVMEHWNIIPLLCGNQEEFLQNRSFECHWWTIPTDVSSMSEQQESSVHTFLAFVLSNLCDLCFMSILTGNSGEFQRCLSFDCVRLSPLKRSDDSQVSYTFSPKTITSTHWFFKVAKIPQHHHILLAHPHKCPHETQKSYPLPCPNPPQDISAIVPIPSRTHPAKDPRASHRGWWPFKPLTTWGCGMVIWWYNSGEKIWKNGYVIDVKRSTQYPPNVVDDIG